jgi:hypothetical protein
MTDEEQAWLVDAVTRGLDWISPDDAVQMIRERLDKCSVGRAKAMLQTVCIAVPSEVRSCNDDPTKRWEKSKRCSAPTFWMAPASTMMPAHEQTSF